MTAMPRHLQWYPNGGYINTFTVIKFNIVISPILAPTWACLSRNSDIKDNLFAPFSHGISSVHWKSQSLFSYATPSSGVPRPLGKRQPYPTRHPHRSRRRRSAVAGHHPTPGQVGRPPPSRQQRRVRVRPPPCRRTATLPRGTEQRDSSLLLLERT